MIIQRSKKHVNLSFTHTLLLISTSAHSADRTRTFRERVLHSACGISVSASVSVLSVSSAEMSNFLGRPWVERMVRARVENSPLPQGCRAQLVELGAPQVCSANVQPGESSKE
jgi:hypothetical protein